MSSINKDYLNANTSSSAPSAGNYFGMELDYDFGFNQNQLNGNIAGAKWKSAGDQYARAFGYDYDNVNRILKGDFTQTQTGSGYAQDAKVDFSVSGIRYDANGNLLSMKQNGLLIGSSSPIDNLTYKYSGNSAYTNQLSSVSDAVAVNNHLGDFYDGNTSDNDYTYDANGNLTSDKNKAISSITYDYLNLPEVVTITGKGTITYLYDAAGNKLKKTVIDQTITPNKTTVTTYIGGFVYQNDTLQFASHEEGRIRPQLIVPATGYTPANINWVYDYFEKDHLGNVRMVLTEEQKTDIYPAATLETSKIATEENYYTINTSQVVDKSQAIGIPDYANNNVIPNPPVNAPFDNANSAKLYVLNKNSQQTGLGITLKVMAGDKLDIYGKSYYFQNNAGGTSANSAVPILDILTGFLGTPSGGITAAHGAVTAAQLNGITATTVPIGSLLTNQTKTNNATPTKPKAFINYILFDEQFKCVGSGFAPVGDNAVLTDYASVAALHNIVANKNGFVYIYCSNESPVDVFFDNLQVVQTKGQILEETHYYPFGLVMSGISSKAASITPNKEKTFQGQRFDDDLGVNYYSFKYRNHDPQIGRFIQIDPLSDKYVYNSTYAFSENKVINGIELEGLEVVLINEKKDPEIYNAGVANTDKSAVHVYAHGTPSNIDVSGNNSWSSKKGDFQTVLNKSDVYQENKDAKDLTVVIHSCRAGRSYVDEKGNYIPSYAENMSAAFPNLTIIAPDERDAFSSTGKELGPRQIDDPKNNRGDYKDGAAHTTNDKSGNWNVFKNGKLTGSYSASDYNAQGAPSWYERNFQFTPNQNSNTGTTSSQPAPVTKEKEKKN